VETGREVLVLNRKANGPSAVFAPAFAVRFHPAGDLLLSMDRNALRLWRAPSWAEIDQAEKASGATGRRVLLESQDVRGPRCCLSARSAARAAR
jgi:hypothetical protein